MDDDRNLNDSSDDAVSDNELRNRKPRECKTVSRRLPEYIIRGILKLMLGLILLFLLLRVVTCS